MKFTNGQWLIREGLSISIPAEVRDFDIAQDSITVYAPYKPIDTRGATLDGALFTVSYFSPLPDVIGVRIAHFTGEESRGPEFEIHREDVPVKIVNGPEALTLTSGNLTARIQKNTETTKKWAVDFLAGDRAITGSSFGNTGYVVTDHHEVYMKEQLDLKVGECVYGLGERFTSFVKNGQVVDVWNEDGGTDTEQAYKNIPFYLTNRGYGVFVNHPERVSFEVASEKVFKVQFSVPGEQLEYYIIYGPTPKEILEKYTRLTGRPALPPAWSFGLWLSTSFTTDYDEKTVNSFIDGMEKRDLPLAVFHFDCFWMKEYHWCNFEWDDQVFPDPEGMLARLKAKGLKICVWINPYIAQRSRLFAEGKAKGYLLKKSNGDIWQWDKWQAGMGIVDFTNPDACRWFSGYLEKLLNMGVDCFKTDFGERIPTEGVYYFDGSDPMKMHNYYTYRYNKTVFELLEKKLGPGKAVVFARSATVGGQQFPVHWGGDCWANFESMAESLRAGLSLGLSGFGFWSHDIGGFEQTASAGVYKRWVAFGLLSSHSRLHGSSSYRVPWLFDEEAVDVLRFFTKLKCSLMPYLFAKACEANQKGIPVMRAMLLEYPTDPACDYLDRQYMLGDSLLVAPVFSEDGLVSYYVPQGRWTHYLSGEKISGGCWREDHHDYISLPLLVRPNTILAVGKVDNRPDYDYAQDVILHVFELEDGKHASARIYNQAGTPELQVDLQRKGNRIIVQANGSGKGWSLLLRGIHHNVRLDNGGTYQATPMGGFIEPKAYTGTFQIEIEA